MNNTQPIGVIDSGIGGMTVLDKLIEKMPAENYIFIADGKNCPYGTKTNEEIKKCCKDLINYLIKQNVKAIVIACNTASTHVDYLRTLTSVPIISVIEPTAEHALLVSKNHKIGVIATISTINNKKYQNIIEKANSTCYPLACSEFVELVENHKLTEPVVQEVVTNKINALKNTNIDTLIYGCTHFGLLEEKIKNVLGELNYISSGDVTSDVLFKILSDDDKLNLTKMNGTVHIYTTGEVDKIKKVTSWFKKPHEEIKRINVEE